ncbi:hypothetical protein CDAR_254471 [Caerostris darwini]|uniref:Uncharacterized protein n=1 Tax=Caerostris darwini TaxID=1538125 RepID=A0AAV4UB46_9ARAC|nr:hypothetical protein CDAR_254471 [Caerostris darwini]
MHVNCMKVNIDILYYFKTQKAIPPPSKTKFFAMLHAPYQPCTETRLHYLKGLHSDPLFNLIEPQTNPFQLHALKALQTGPLLQSPAE